MDSSTFIDRNEIMKFPFPYKLWVCVHMESCDFLRWNRDGTLILLDIIALEDYLNSSLSIFNLKNRSTFLEHLVQFRFERVNTEPEAEEDLVLLYRNENFLRHRLDLLAKMRRHTYQMVDPVKMECLLKGTGADKMLSAIHSVDIKRHVAERMLGDLCFMSHGAISDIHKTRIRLQTVLNFERETRILLDKLRVSDAGAQPPSQRSKVSSKPETLPMRTQTNEFDQIIELPVDMFENPHDSVLHFDNFSPEYAGYYGNSNKELVIHFFGDYLPKYEHGSMEVKKITADMKSNNQLGRNTHTHSHAHSNSPHQQQTAISCGGIKITSTPLQPRIMDGLDLSSSLEPIFKQEDSEDGGVNSADCVDFGIADTIPQYDDNDVSMDDEYMDYHGNAQYFDEMNEVEVVTTPTVDQPNTKEFPQMPPDIQVEMTDSDPEKGNFRNFFSQYRSSMNLLYERQ